MPSRIYPSPMNALAVEFMRCDYCGAEPGQWCRVVRGVTRGKFTTYLHSGRQRALDAAWRVGIALGREWAIGAVLNSVQRRYEWRGGVRRELKSWDDIAAYLQREYDRATAELAEKEGDALTFAGYE